MVESTLFESRPDSERIGRRKKPATLAMSTVVHVLIGGALVLIPLLQTQAVPPVALPPPPVQMTSPARFVNLAVAPRAGGGSSHPAPVAVPQPMIAPATIPETVTYIADAIVIGPDIGRDARIGGGPNGPGNGLGPAGLGIGDGIGDGSAPAAALPPPAPPLLPPPPKIVVREPIRVSSGYQKSLLVHQVDPVYPTLARRGRIEGTVIAEARISKTGEIDSLRIISGNQLFRQSVLDAVKQWRYRPTLLSGEPIDVITTITVNFTLN